MVANYVTAEKKKFTSSHLSVPRRSLAVLQGVIRRVIIEVHKISKV